jgi:hypothetical protein
MEPPRWTRGFTPELPETGGKSNANPVCSRSKDSKPAARRITIKERQKKSTSLAKFFTFLD